MSKGTGLRPLAAAWVLFFLAPYVGECLLGNLPLTAVAGVLILAPLYGGGALLIREVTRRLGGGWPTFVLFGAAYALVEEALVDQMVFTPRYLELPSFAGYAPIPGFGASGTLIVASLTMHTVWSICVPVALAEALSGEPDRPWLRWPGTTVTTVLFLLACVVLGDDQAQKLHFYASTLQYAVASAAVLVLIVAAVVVARRPRAISTGSAPSARTAGLVAFAITSGYWIVWMIVPGGESWWAQWPPIAAWLVAVPLVAARFVSWSRRPGWTARHNLSVACGALMTYFWVCPIQSVSAGVPLLLALAGWIVYGGLALWLRHRVLPRGVSS